LTRHSQGSGFLNSWLEFVPPSSLSISGNGTVRDLLAQKNVQGVILAHPRIRVEAMELPAPLHCAGIRSFREAFYPPEVADEQEAAREESGLSAGERRRVRPPGTRSTSPVRFLPRLRTAKKISKRRGTQGRILPGHTFHLPLIAAWNYAS